MRKAFLLVPLVFCILSQVFGEYDLTTYEQFKLDLISKIKEFAQKELGFKPTKNFLKFDEKGCQNFLFYSKKTEIPFSHIDPLMGFERALCAEPQSDFDGLKSKASKSSGVNLSESEYDFLFYGNVVESGSAPVTRSVLERGLADLVELVVHEDWHENVNLPSHIEESSAQLVSYVAMLRYLKREDQMDYYLERKLLIANLFNKCWDDLERAKLYLKNNYILEKDYFNFRYAVIHSFLKEMGENGFYLNPDTLNPALIAHIHSYSYYFPLMYDLFYAKNKDIKAFINIMRNIPIKRPPIRSRNFSKSAEKEKRKLGFA